MNQYGAISVFKKKKALFPLKILNLCKLRSQFTILSSLLDVQNSTESERRNKVLQQKRLSVENLQMQIQNSHNFFKRLKF